MSLLKKIVPLAVAAVMGLMVYSWLTGISDVDIYAYHKADYRTGDRVLVPGSIAAVSQQGNITEICSLKANGLASGSIEKAIYYNQLREDFPEYVKSIGVVMALFGGNEEVPVAEDTPLPELAFDPDKLPASGREFLGGASEIRQLDAANDFVEPDCETRMAWHLSNGYKVCTVRKTLNATRLRNDGSIEVQTVAVAFAEHSNFVGPTTFAKADLDYNSAAQSANGKPCEGSALPWTAKMRRTLGIIQRMPLPV